MRLLATLLAGLVLGIVLGWYFGYTRPVVQANRDARKYLGQMEHDDSMTVAVALAAICQLEQERTVQAKELLAKQLGSYYVIYGPPDNPKKRISEDRIHVLREIEEAARTYPVVQAAIDRAKANTTK